MKTIFNISVFAAILCLFISCKDDDPSDAFIVRGENEVSISKDGGTISIPISTTVAYSVTPADPWCTVSGKNAIGFDIIVEFNESVEPRSTNIVVAAPDFDPVTIVVTQDKGVPFFNIEDGQKRKSFAKEGGAQTVTFNTNLEYTIEPGSGSFCTISEKGKNGFKITTPVNDDVKRNETLTIKPAGLPDINILVTQSGGAVILKNGDFTSGMDNWVASGTPNTFEVTTYGAFKTVSRTWAVRLTDFEARLIQEVTGISDGTYVLSADVSGGANDLHLIFIDKDGIESMQEVKLGGMSTFSMPVEVVGGECSVGFRVKGYKDVGLYWNITNFKLE
ncbi:MAG: hypothetical protein LBL79_09915 [Prevotella sp.]|jgi:hypothetical protein|nr:hypothetical protein [Prevotella sp.]